MVSTRTRIILVTIGGFVVTVALEAVALLAYVTLMLHQSLALSSFRPWLAFPPLILIALIGVLGGVLAATVVVLRSPKPVKAEAPPSTQPPVAPAAAGQFPPKIRELGRMHFLLPATGPYVMLTVDQARDIESMVDRMQEEIESLTDRLATADRLLGEMARGTFVSKLTDPGLHPSTEPAQETSKAGLPMVVCQRCGTKFEQTIPGRTKCPDCWSLEEYLSKPVEVPSPPSPAPTSAAIQASPQAAPVDDFSVIVKRLERSPNFLVTLRYVGDHPAMKVVDIAKEMKLGRGTVSDRVNDLVRAGLVEKENGGFKLTAKGVDARNATATIQVDDAAGTAVPTAPAPAPST